MIITTQSNAHFKDFENLLSKAISELEQQALNRPNYFLNRGGTKFEQDVYEAICKHADSTDFKDKIELVSGHRFPDIVAYVNETEGIGVEVKTSLKNQWKSVGGSIFENTRLVGIERIYLLFGKLIAPPEFRYKKYEECLYNVAITHSPRYLIDMDLSDGDTIFDKIGIPYDDLRTSDRPFAPIKNYLRKALSKHNEDIWWVDDVEAKDISVRLWGNLPSSKKAELRVEAISLFPQIFGQHTKKYAKLATWLVAKHGVVAPSLRDTFTAGGKISLTVNNQTYANLPKIYFHLQENSAAIKKTVEQTSVEDLEYYWSTKNVQPKEKLKTWIDLVQRHTDKAVSNKLNISGFFDHTDITKENIHSEIDTGSSVGNETW